MFDKFKDAAETLGNTEVHRFATKAEALTFIEDFLTKEEIIDAPGFYALWAKSAMLDDNNKKTLAVKFPGLKFDITRELARKAKVGITQMEWGLANMGTLAQDSTEVERRLASALPWIHIALLPTDTIVADLPALITKMHPAKSNYITLIAGPSKTADIERVLAIGVHGPERLVIVCIDEQGV
ncbi:MAG: Lactate utilization protein C [Syntrophus sp. SKADARSKE-3]|nr:Lactate utilization protein C [Syntrophus sp. SKADARSKE-3]